jgi:hypothetical protein
MQTSSTNLTDAQFQPAQATVMAQPVGFGRRFGALALDWVILFFMLPLIAMIVGLTTDIIGLSNSVSNFTFLAAVIAAGVGGFTICYRLGATPGMLAASSRVMQEAQDSRLGRKRALLKGLTTFMLVASWFWVFNVFFFSDVRLDGRTTSEMLIDYGALVIFLTSIAGRLWMLVDRNERTLFDRILHVKVIRKPISSR